ncbi:HK97-gp10 family putative phage morphogenesis protein [Bartonella sp. DGB1]|uniref:HK97-gp10 family putative phage morphogenesis protein n=1 Tax=Bartonella sp. DGB1 TaxID=3239807 RepID=UPI0035243A8E
MITASLDKVSNFTRRLKLLRERKIEMLEATFEVMEQEANKTVRQMRERVPVDSEALKNSIGWTWASGARPNDILAGSFNKNNCEYRVYISAGTRDKYLGDRDAYYFHFVEFGTINQSAQPFFFPVWNGGKKQIKAKIRKELNCKVKQLKQTGLN